MDRFRKLAVAASISTSASAALLGSSAAAAQDVSQHVFHLPSQPLAASLRAVSVASGKSIVAPADLVSAKLAPALDGAFNALAAVEFLLAGSGLRARAVANGLIIEPGSPTRPTARQGVDHSGEIIVTGSRIRGAQVTSPVITRTAADFRDQGKTDLGDAVRSIPQSFGGGQNPGLGSNVPTNRGADVGGGSSVNLRGLGSDATLTLLDNRRLAFTGSSQSIDVSAIPFNAVDRLEIVPDGASAIYGSDAVAGVVNIILRRRFDGVQIGGRLGAATDGGDFQQQYWTTGGVHWTGGSVAGSYEYGSNSSILSNQRSYAATTRPGLTLFPAIRHHSATLVGGQALTSSLTLDVDALYNTRWSNTEFPTVQGGDLRQGRALLSFKDRSFALAPSLHLALPNGWRATLSGAVGKERVDYKQVQCAIDTCFLGGQGYYRNSEKSAEIGADGPLFRLPGGNARMALGAGYRAIGFQRFAINGATVNTQHDQDSYFAYGELELPLIGREQGIPMIERLTATGALRYERYPRLGAVGTPKLGLIYSPTPDVDLKGSWGRSFRAPTLYQQYSPRTAIILPPAFFGGTGYPATAGALLVIGGNPALKPERATTWSATLGGHPRLLPGARFELSYFNVNYRDRIVAPIAFLSQALSNPIFAAQVTRSPSAALQTALIAGAGTFVNAVPGTYDPANIVAVIDNGSVNAGHQTAHGLDLLAEYKMDFAGDQFLKITADASYLTSAQQLSASQATIPLAGRIFSPPKWRGQGTIAWSRRSLTLSSSFNYSGGVLDARTSTPVPIDGMTTFDATARLRIADGTSALRGTELTLSVSNIFNAKPSIIPTTGPSDTPYDSTNYSPVGRFISFGISKKF